MKWPSYLFLGLLLPAIAIGQTSPDYVAQAEAREAKGDYRGALSAYTQAISHDPKNVRAYLGRATLYSHEGRYDRAIADDTKAIQLDPKNPVAWTNRGNARTFSGDLKGALADYTKAIELDPHHVHAYINRGDVKNFQQDYAGAVADYTMAIEIDPHSDLAYYNRAGAERSAGNYAAARADYATTLQLNPKDAEAWLNRAVLEILDNNLDAATTDLNTSARLVSPNLQAYVIAYRWIVAAKRGHAKEATRELASKIRQGAASPGYWDWNITQYLAGNLNEQQFLATAANAQNIHDKHQLAKAAYFIGAKRSADGDRSGAARYFQQCLKSGNPSLHEYNLAKAELAGGSK